MHTRSKPATSYKSPVNRRWYFIMACLLLGTLHTNAQTNPEIKEPCVQKDLPGIIREWRHKPPKKSASRYNSLLAIPTVGFNPTSGFMIGGAAQYVTRERHSEKPYSYIQATLFATTKKQLLFQARNNIYTHHDKIFLSGDWRFLLFSQPTYGLSTKAPEGGALQRHYSINGYEVKDDSLVQPMRFNHIRFYQTISWRIRKTPVYAGLGYHLDYFYAIKDLKLDTAKGLYTSHYLYSNAYGFSTRKYVMSGISLNLTGDTRDNLVNARKGYYYNINWRIYPTFLGSAVNSTLLNLEWRSFHNIFPTDPRKIFAIWLMGNFSPGGKLPYLALPALGYDQRGRAGRGYAQGRFRGPDMLYGEMEYRFPLSRCGGIFSGVAFLNFTTADNTTKTVSLFENIAPGGGVGLRVMVDKLSRSNLQLDVALGRKSVGIYFGIGETF